MFLHGRVVRSATKPPTAFSTRPGTFPVRRIARRNSRLCSRRLFHYPRSMNISEDLREYAVKQGIVEEEALKKGTEEKSREITEKGSALYAKA